MSGSNQMPAFHAARPTILLEGEERPELTGGLISLLVEETTEGLYRCEMTVGNWGSTGNDIGYLYLDRKILDFGKRIAIESGAGDHVGTIFSGRIMGLEARYYKGQTPQLVVLAEDRLQDLRMTRRTRTFENMSDQDVFQQVASQHSLQPDIQLDGAVQHRVLAQVNQSDLAFLRDRARAIGAEVWVEDDRLFVQARSRRGTADVVLTYGQNLREFSVLADLAGQRTSFAVTGWDPVAKEPVKSEATESAIANELSGHPSGASILQQKLGERKEQLVHMSPVTDGEARVLAEAAFRRAARRFVIGAGVTEGDPRLRVGAQADLRGLDTMFDGKYYIVEVRHLFDMAQDYRTQGYRTHFRVERPWIGV